MGRQTIEQFNSARLRPPDFSEARENPTTKLAQWNEIYLAHKK
jgi:hypothetical protein